MSNDWDDDDVGYGRPPRWTRFEKGQSGNPKGRPKKQPGPEPAKTALPESQADNALRRELDRKVRITDAHGTREETMADAVVRAQVVKAAQGHVPAIRDVRKAQKELELAEAERARVAAQKEAEERKAAELEREAAFSFMQGLRARQAESWAAAIRDGKAEPENPWPHPDDVSLDLSNRTYLIRGPIDAEQLPMYRHFEALRDRYFYEIIVSLRARKSAEKARGSLASCLFGIYDSLLPTRWAMGDDFELLATSFLAMPLKCLRDRLARSERRAKQLEPASFTQPIRKSDSYTLVNHSMKPTLKQMGYVSYAQFERAWEESGGNPPWPRKRESGLNPRNSSTSS